MRIMRQWMLLATAMVGTLHGAFVPPEEGSAPFRRDKVPVDVSTMTGLSAQLVTLAEHANGGEAADARTRAQLVGLALALDPANRRARDLVESMEAGENVDPPADGALKVARSRVWNLLGWLEQPEAGEDGQALGACLSDVLARVDPEHPDAAERAERERGAWRGWVAEVAAFRDRTPEPDEGSGESMAGNDDDEEEEPEEPEGAKLRISKATALVPLWYYDDDAKATLLRVVPLEVRGEARGDGREIRIEGMGDNNDGWRRAIGQRLTAALEARHGTLPKGLTLRYSLPKGVAPSSRNHGGGTASMLVAADALFTGVEPGAAVLGEVDEDGGIGLPVGFWQTLRQLADLKGGRLILPADAMDFLPPLLTLDKAEFFIRQEVLLAKDTDAMLTLASGKPPERVLEAEEAFREIRLARGTRSLGGFVGFDSTRQRLAKIVEFAPEHVSARMLALRGTSQWPQRLERPIYAREARASLEPMREALSRRWDELSIRELQEAEEECRDSLKRLEKLYGSVADREELLDPAYSTVKTLAGLVSDMRRRDESFRVDRAVLPVVRSYRETVKLLTDEAGDAKEYPIPFDRWK